MKKLFFLFLFLLFILGCSEETNNILTIVTEEKEINVTVEIADSYEEHKVGLSNRELLDENTGMLFIFSYPKTLSFWMKDTFIPLDIMYIDENFKITEIKENLQPCDTSNCHVYPSLQPAMYALEVNAGFCEKHSVVKGNTVVLP